MTSNYLEVYFWSGQSQEVVTKPTAQAMTLECESE